MELGKLSEADFTYWRGGIISYLVILEQSFQKENIAATEEDSLQTNGQ